MNQLQAVDPFGAYFVIHNSIYAIIKMTLLPVLIGITTGTKKN